jgi:hypothetical protein
MLAFTLLNGASVVLAIFVAAATGGGGRAGAFFFTTLCVYLIVIHSVVMAGGLAGYLTVGGAVVALAGTAAGAVWRARAPSDERPCLAHGAGEASSSSRSRGR